MSSKDSYSLLRSEMVIRQMRARGIGDARVLAVMQHIPRHEFVAAELRHLAYRDCPLPIGDNQTISQPFMVAFMTQMLGLKGNETVLEVGTGSGYQTAVLCELAAQVYSLEYHPRLAGRAATTLAALGYNNVEVHVGDGSQGLPDMAPFDAIIVTAAAPAVPGPLRAQMNPDGGRMVIPVGDDDNQYLELITRHESRWLMERMIPVRFVPLVGRYGIPSRNRFNDSDDSAPV